MEKQKTEDIVPASSPEDRPFTYGEKAVGLTFNHGEGDIFHQVKEAK